METIEFFPTYKKLVFSVAYNMTGSKIVSEDIVQDITLKFLENPISESITDPRNYIIRATVNHCLNVLKKDSRTQYKGTWLPEPFINNEESTFSNKFERRDLLTYELSFLVEQLTSQERAVFVLREAFDFDHKEIAEAINISDANSRQLFRRAKEKVQNAKHQSITNSQSIELAKQFVKLMSEGNLEELIKLFNKDISIIGDGGGKAPAISKPIFGKENVADFFMKLFGNSQLEPSFEFTEILSQPAIAIYVNGKCFVVQVLSIKEGKISQVFAVLNPDKLTPFQKN
ncbi:MAG: sigma-70 family RNA polymerase sigma factor [Flavobacterium sp.]|uniref:sigma-70 family RNA polymerase sigma factor n=1 Tax=Flavobacterium sp. TaxID=239 RepID=UPI003267CA3C